MQKLQKRSNGVKILAIETSCDDSGIAILEDSVKIGQPKMLANLISSQVKIHAKWGGVVPMLAKREHQRNLVPLLKEALEKASLLSSSSHPDPAVAGEGSKDSSSLNELGTQNDKSKTLNKILEREPELLKKLLPFLKKYQKPDVDYIAVTYGPGLEPALWVGVNLAKALSFIWNLPILPVNHIEGHIAAAFAVGESRGISKSPASTRSNRGEQFPPRFRSGQAIFDENKKLPAMCLVVSGGHTQLILIKKIGEYEIIGETRDDAAGEAFDKVAKMLGLGYPGGPAISQLASLDESRRVERWKSQIPRLVFDLSKRAISNNQTKIKPQANRSAAQSLNYLITKPPNPFSFPRPMLNSGDFDFSFSGLKTAVLYTLQKMTKTQIKKATPAIAIAFQEAVIDVLVQKTINSAKKYNARSIWLAGGVAANQVLRQNLKQIAQKNNFNFLAPPDAYCGDNAAMIALAAFYQLKQLRVKEMAWLNLKTEPNLRIS